MALIQIEVLYTVQQVVNPQPNGLHYAEYVLLSLILIKFSKSGVGFSLNINLLDCLTK